MDNFPNNLFRINYPDNLPDQVYYAMGLITVNWSFVEQGINHCVKITFHEFKGKYIAYKNEFPLSLKNKISFLRKSLQNINGLSSFKDRGLLLMDRTTKLSKERHNMAHGVIIDATNTSLIIAKYDAKELHKIKQINFSINDFHSVGKKMLDLANDLAQFWYSLAQFHIKP